MKGDIIMKAETKAKWQLRWGKTKRFLKDYAVPIFGGATIGAAWGGWSRSIKLEKELKHTQNVVNNNAREQILDRNKLLDLEHQQTLLFEKALRVTEGKTE